MEVSRMIGEFKKAHNIAIVQASRWESILNDMVSKGKDLGLPEVFILDVFTDINEFYVSEQNKILEK